MLLVFYGGTIGLNHLLELAGSYSAWWQASQRLSASLCGQLIVSETLFALVYSFVWDAAWPLPVAQSHAASVDGASDASHANSLSG